MNAMEFRAWTDKVMSDPSTSYWLRNAIAVNFDRDPVDAANDAALLGDLLNERLHQLVQS